MQQIADWLKELGLSEYAERFAENGIDVSVLPHLSDQDLKDLGVLLGHRRKMLAAIGESSNCSRACCRFTYHSGADADRREWCARRARQLKRLASAAISR